MAAFDLNMVTSAKILSSFYDQSKSRWVVKFQTPDGQRTAVAKHLVQATGFGSQKPYLPPMENEDVYKGVSIHSCHYSSAASLKEKGAKGSPANQTPLYPQPARVNPATKSVLIIGSANTAFDVLEDCHAAGLATTMVVRSPTYILPLEHVCDKRGLGAYDAGVAAIDRMSMTLPTWVDGHLTRALFAHAAAQEPDRYVALAATGFPVFDSTHPDASLPHHLLERGGGHYVDIGGTKLIVDGRVGVKAGVEPVGYTATGLRFSDGTMVVDVDAVVWCTGYADKNARHTAAEILGAGSSNGDHEENAAGVMGASEVAGRLDDTWGVDDEGEIRGMWKRQLRVDNFGSWGGTRSTIAGIPARRRCRSRLRWKGSCRRRIGRPRRGALRGSDKG